MLREQRGKPRLLQKVLASLPPREEKEVLALARFKMRGVNEPLLFPPWSCLVSSHHAPLRDKDL